MHKPESVLENYIHKVLWDFEIQAVHVIPTRKPDQMIIKKKKRKNRIERLVGFAVSAAHRAKR